MHNNCICESHFIVDNTLYNSSCIMNLILWIGFIGLIIPGAISSKHHDASKNTFNMNHIRRNKNHKGKSSKQSMILQVKVLFII